MESNTFAEVSQRFLKFRLLLLEGAVEGLLADYCHWRDADPTEALHFLQMGRVCSYILLDVGDAFMLEKPFDGGAGAAAGGGKDRNGRFWFEGPEHSLVSPLARL